MTCAERTVPALSDRRVTCSIQPVNGPAHGHAEFWQAQMPPHVSFSTQACGTMRTPLEAGLLTCILAGCQLQ